MRDASPPDVENSAVCPGARSPVLGVTLKLAGCRNSVLPDDEFPDAQPDSTVAKMTNKLTKMERFDDRSKDSPRKFEGMPPSHPGAETAA
jgi:hypothetical protein